MPKTTSLVLGRGQQLNKPLFSLAVPADLRPLLSGQGILLLSLLESAVCCSQDVGSHSKSFPAPGAWQEGGVFSLPALGIWGTAYRTTGRQPARGQPKEASSCFEKPHGTEGIVQVGEGHRCPALSCPITEIPQGLPGGAPASPACWEEPQGRSRTAEHHLPSSQTAVLLVGLC